MVPDPAWLAERRDKLLGLVITHAHEDHLGAVAPLWPQLRCPVYASPFAAAVLRFLLIGWGVESMAVMVVAQLMHGLTFGAFHAAAIATINRFFPGNTRSRGQALYSSISFGAGGLVGGLLSGWVWETLGGEASFILSSLYAFIGLLLVARWVRGSALEPTA